LASELEQATTTRKATMVAAAVTCDEDDGGGGGSLTFERNQVVHKGSHLTAKQG